MTQSELNCLLGFPAYSPSVTSKVSSARTFEEVSSGTAPDLHFFPLHFIGLFADLTIRRWVFGEEMSLF